MIRKGCREARTAAAPKHGERIEHDGVADKVEHGIDLLCFGNLLRQIAALDFAALGAELFKHGESLAGASGRDHPGSGVDRHLERSLAE